MIHEGHHLALRLKPRDHFARAHTGFDEFDRHAAPDRLFLLSQPDLAHAAFPYFLEQVVATNRHPGGFTNVYGLGRSESAFDGGGYIRVAGFDWGHVCNLPSFGSGCATEYNNHGKEICCRFRTGGPEVGANQFLSDDSLPERRRTGKGKPSRNPGGSLDAAGALSPNVHATSDGQHWRPVCCFALRCVSVPGMAPGKLTVESQRSNTSTPEGIAAVRVGWNPGGLVFSGASPCVPGGVRPSTRWQAPLKGLAQESQDRRPCAVYSTRNQQPASMLQNLRSKSIPSGSLPHPDRHPSQ